MLCFVGVLMVEFFELLKTIVQNPVLSFEAHVCPEHDIVEALCHVLFVLVVTFLLFACLPFLRGGNSGLGTTGSGLLHQDVVSSVCGEGTL